MLDFFWGVTIKKIRENDNEIRKCSSQAGPRLLRLHDMKHWKQSLVNKILYYHCYYYCFC